MIHQWGEARPRAELPPATRPRPAAAPADAGSVSQSVITKLLPVEHMVHYTHSVFSECVVESQSSARWRSSHTCPSYPNRNRNRNPNPNPLTLTLTLTRWRCSHTCPSYPNRNRNRTPNPNPLTLTLTLSRTRWRSSYTCPSSSSSSSSRSALCASRPSRSL